MASETDLTGNQAFDKHAAAFGWVYDNRGTYRGQHWDWYVGQTPGVVLLRRQPDLVSIVRFHGLTADELLMGKVKTSADLERIMSSLRLD